MRSLGRSAVLTLAVLALAAPALAVTFGPLQKSGSTSSERKGFYLNLSNPYERAFEFRVFVPPEQSEIAERIRILPDKTWLNGGAKRRILVVAGGLAPGETLDFTICAERVQIEKETIHARVCSSLSASRTDHMSN